MIFLVGDVNHVNIEVLLSEFGEYQEKINTLYWEVKKENEVLEELCRASYYLLMGATYDPEKDTDPTSWLETRNRLLPLLREYIE